MKTFRITRHLEAVCESESTRYGFRHIATLLRDGNEIEHAKACYYNRTWEAYEFQSVLEGLQEKTAGRLSIYEARAFRKTIRTGGKQEAENNNRIMKTVAMVARMGDIFGKSQKESNDWKARMLKAGLQDKGLIMPDDWETLSEEEKQKRLDGAIATLS
jgi:hypothetical protein